MTIAVVPVDGPISPNWAYVKMIEDGVFGRISLTRWQIPMPKTFNLLGEPVSLLKTYSKLLLTLKFVGN